jgi:Zn-dependent protease
MRGDNPFYAGDDLHHAGTPRVSFSGTEVLHLSASVVVLTVSFALFMDGTGFRVWEVHPMTLLAAFLAVGSGFVLHELAHKVVAQRYGHWAEFRAQFMGLGLTVLLAIFGPILFAAPGAVLIQGRVTPRESGLISLVGPGTNFVLALVAYPFAWAVNADAVRPRIGFIVTSINAALCLFNLLPFGPFDGRKVLRWSKVGYAVSLVLAVTLVALVVIWKHSIPFS